jgi:hypothetical protein
VQVVLLFQNMLLLDLEKDQIQYLVQLHQQVEEQEVVKVLYQVPNIKEFLEDLEVLEVEEQ